MSQNGKLVRLIYVNAKMLNTVEVTYKENYHRMFCVVQKMIGDKEAVHDIVQEVFISYYQKLKNNETIANTQSWLLRAVINKSIDFIRQKQKTTTLLVAEDLKQESRCMVEEKQKKEMVRTALTMLGAQEMLLAVLYSEGFSYKEMAELTGIKYASVGKTLARTLQKLKVILNKMNYEMY